MNKKFKLSLVFSALTFASGLVSAAQFPLEPLALGHKNYVKDGDFETPKLATGEDYRAMDTIGPWDKRSTNYWVSVHRNNVLNMGVAGAKGAQHVGLAERGRVFQPISGLDPHKVYEVELDYALHTLAKGNYNKNFKVGILTPSGNQEFQRYAFQARNQEDRGNRQWRTAEFTFSPQSSSIGFMVYGSGGFKNRYRPGVLLDNISMREVKLAITARERVISADRNVFTIQKGAEVEILSSDPSRNGAIFEVTPELFNKCQFADYSKLGEKGDPLNPISVAQGFVLPTWGPKIKIIGDPVLEFKKFTKEHPNGQYHFVYGDYDADQLRVVTSDLCRAGKGKGKFTLDLVAADDHTADIKKSDKPTIFDINSKPVVLGEEYIIQAQVPESLYAVTRKDFLSCNVSDSAVRMGDFDAINNNQLKLNIAESNNDKYANFTPGNTVYLVQAANADGVSQSCKDGAKFSFRVSR